MSELVKELRHLAKEFPAIKYGDEEARSCAEITVTAAADRIVELEERLSWAIQLSDDHNCGPSGTWSDRFNAEIDAAILAAAQEAGE
jgi:hypothetical protein